MNNTVTNLIVSLMNHPGSCELVLAKEGPVSFHSSVLKNRHPVADLVAAEQQEGSTVEQHGRIAATVINGVWVIH